jgi:hypothetical protein
MVEIMNKLEERHEEAVLIDDVGWSDVVSAG